jgi:hypothetical protein
MVKLYQAAILAKKNFEVNKSKKQILKNYSRIHQINNASNIRVNRSFELIKATANENNKVNKIKSNIKFSNIHFGSDSVMKMNNVQIIEFENNNNNTNCHLNSPKIYKIMNANQNSIVSFDKYINDKNTYLQTEANIRETSKELESRFLDTNRIEKRKEDILLNGKSIFLIKFLFQIKK